MKPEIKLNILIYKDKKDWIAHCLEMDIVTANNSLDSVKKDIEDLIKAQITFAIENNNSDYLFKSAPLEIWDKLKRVKECNNQFIEIKPKKNILRSSPINEVELCFAI